MVLIVVTTAANDLIDLAETAWGIIANVNHGDWDGTDPDWHDAAIHWRDRYHDLLNVRLADRDRWEQELFGPF